MVELLPINQINELIEEIEERTIDSRFHLRLDKQELVKGKLVISEKDTVKVKIHTPIYNKKDTVKIFTEIFQMVN
jgi:RNA binding exosome subunit